MSHEPTQLGSAAEVQSNDNQVLWSLRQKEINGNPTNTHSSSSRVRMEGIWSTSPHVNVPSNFFADPKNIKAVAKQSTISGHSPVSSKPNDGSAHDQVEDGKKTGNPTEIWVFGVNLTNNFTNASLPDKELGCPAIIPGGPKESTPITACETENAQNSNYSLSNKEQKQIISDALPTERPSKLASVPSMRTRTKVHVQLKCISLKIPFIFCRKVK